MAKQAAGDERSAQGFEWGRWLLAGALALGAGCATERLLAFQIAFEAGATIDIGDAITPRLIPDAVLARASATLREQAVAAPPPSLIERGGLALGFATARSGTARLQQQLAASTTLLPGPKPGTIVVDVRSMVASRAAAMATATAAAMVADRAETIAAVRRERDAVDGRNLQVLNDAATVARRRLADLGAPEDDPVALRAQAAQTTATKKARLDAFRLMLASGSPPLGNTIGLPPSVAPLQTSYLDIKRQLLDAQRTLGDRNPTLINLKASERQVGGALTAEWKRLAGEAEADWKAARSREGALAAADTTRDAKTRQAIETARFAVTAADDAVVRFRATLGARKDGQPYRLAAAASVPQTPVGPSFLIRLIAAFAAAMGAGACGLAWRRRPSAAAPGRPTASPLRQDESRVAPPLTPRTVTPRTLVPRAVHVASAAALKPEVESQPQPMVAALEPEPVPEVRAFPAAGDILSNLLRTRPRYGCALTGLVGSVEPGIDPSRAAYDLARDATDAGLRVLLLEGPRAEPALAARLEPEATPVIVDVLGILRVVMADPQIDRLHLAPDFPEAEKIVSGLTRHADVPFVGDVTEAFDLVLIDAGYVGDDRHGLWAGIADAVIRVGTPSRVADEAFFAALNGLDMLTDFVGTVRHMADARSTRDLHNDKPPHLRLAVDNTLDPMPTPRPPIGRGLKPESPEVRRGSGRD